MGTGSIPASANAALDRTFGPVEGDNLKQGSNCLSRKGRGNRLTTANIDGIGGLRAHILALRFNRIVFPGISI